ncbi:MAG: hypothetical protein JWO38_6257, partial [Gemmataceae bacterium]|nr:hypothetical protein [Gemmataceae bacterium]
MTVAAVLFVAVFGLLMASFPARNGDVWKYLADGRDVAHGGPGGWGPTWLYGLVSYGVFLAAGGAGLVAAKAAAVGAQSVVMLRASRTIGGWQIPVVCTGVAVLAMGTRLLLQPATLSYLFLALTIWLLRREGETGPHRDRVWPGWPLVLLFAVWANVAPQFVLGLATVALTWAGRSLDGQGGSRGRYFLRRAAAVMVLAAAAAASPAHVTGFRWPAEFESPAEHGTATQYGSRPITSPFERAYLSTFKASPAGLAYYPLFGLGLLSFLAALPRWRWER